MSVPKKKTLETATAPVLAVVPTDSTQMIELPKLDIKTAILALVGDTELVTQPFTEKARRQIEDKQAKRATAGGREKRDPAAEYESSKYVLPDGRYGIKAVAFKAAAVEACTSIGKQNITKMAARQAFFVVAEPGTELVAIEGEPEMRTDMVRVGMGSADVRYRASFKKWSVKLTVRYNARMLSPGQLANLFNTAGFAVGVGEGREALGWGRWHVE